MCYNSTYPTLHSAHGDSAVVWDELQGEMDPNSMDHPVDYDRLYSWLVTRRDMIKALLGDANFDSSLPDPSQHDSVWNRWMLYGMELWYDIPKAGYAHVRDMAGARKDTIQSIENGKRKIIRDDYTGKIETINTPLLQTLLVAGYLPVIAPLAVSATGEALNVDADRAAAMLAAALQAGTLLLLTAVPGLMRSFPDESTLIRNLPRLKLEEALNYAEGRMKKKILGTQEALQGGVSRVIIADGRVQHPISDALAGQGTMIE